MEQKGSFIGFTFGNRHSSKLGIFRTSEGDRFSHNLVPKMREQTVDLATNDEIYYWDSKYTSREMPISFAFYGMSEEQLRQLKKVFNDKKIHKLILDEEPYKVWSAKLTGVAICKHLCFEKDEQRFYYGEGTFVFTTYYPFAQSRYLYIEDYTQENIREWVEDDFFLNKENEEGFIYPAILTYDYLESDDTAIIASFEKYFDDWLEESNLLVSSDLDLAEINSSISFCFGNGLYWNLDEWQEASKIPSNKEYGDYSAGKYKLFNAGDYPTPFRLYLAIGETPQTVTIQCADSKIELSSIAAKEGDSYILIDGTTHAIRGCDASYKPTKNLYNEKITSGDFFALPIGEFELKTPQGRLEFSYLYL